MKSKAISLLIALSFWGVPTQAQTAAPIQFNTQYQNKQLESVIYKTDAPQSMVPTRVAAIQQHKRNYRTSENKKVVQISGQSQRPTEGRVYSKGEVQDLIIKYSAQYGISPEAPLCIAYHESGFNSKAKNKHSTAAGTFQYLSGTWASTDEGKAGMSVYDAESNVKAAIKYMASRRSTQPWEVRNKCPKVKSQ